MTKISGNPHRVYLDNAATSWPKPESVLAEVERYIRDCGATAGRGAYASGLEADRWLQHARRSVAELIGGSASEVAFCSSGTHALNAVMWGLLRPGSHIITTAMEHNSVLRPLAHLKNVLGVEFDVVECDGDGRAVMDQAADLVRPATCLLAVGHASNVTGAMNYLEPWRALAAQCGAILMVDASQTLGYASIDVQAMGIDVLAAAGHKGLRGLAGTGLVYVHQNLHAGFRPLLVGGTGRESESMDATADWPYCIEAGNLNLPGVVSMAVAADELLALEPAALHSGWFDSYAVLVRGLSQIAGVELVGCGGAELQTDDPRVPVVSVRVGGWDVHDLASVLDANFGIEARAGWHCAALVHTRIGSDVTAGTLRLSTGRATTTDDVQRTLDAFRALADATN